MFILMLLYLENNYTEQENKLSDAIDCLYYEIINDIYDVDKTNNFSAINKTLAQSMAYINEEELNNHDFTKLLPITLTPITTRSYHEAFNIGFDIHFMDSQQHMPIESAINKETNQLWGKITLSPKASSQLRSFGISIFCRPADISKEKYVFIKFSNSNELFMPETADNEKIILPQMPSLYLMISVDNQKNSIEILNILRIIISNRTYILQKFAKDLSSDDMNRLIAERRFNRALSITKASKHATEQSERLMIYSLERDNLSDKLIGQIRRLLANRTVAGLYQIESILFELENRPDSKNNSDNSVIYDSPCTSLWSADDDKDQYTQIWNLLKQGFAIYGNEEVDSNCKIKLTFDIDKSVTSSKQTCLLEYESFQEDNLTLDFIFLFANNAIRHSDWGRSTNDMKFKISIEGNFLVMRSSTGMSAVEKKRFIRTARAIVIPPNVRKSLCESGEKHKDTDGITLWSVARYFRRLQNHFNELGNSDDRSIILPVKYKDNCMTVGYEYFNVSYEKNDNNCFDFVVRLKCIKNREEA